MKYIDIDTVRDDFINTVYEECSVDKDNNRANRIIDAFDNFPTIEAEPVRHGTWKHVLGMNSKCSECGHYFPVRDFESRPFDINYCPQCGAKMDGGIPDATIHDKK